MTAESATKVKSKAGDTPRPKVLVAEDSSITSDLLKLLLNHRGYHVDIAKDGLQALAALREHRYDVALLDFHLPQMDGVQVASLIRKEAKGRMVPKIIAMTADIEGLLAHVENCENFDHILPKPLDIFQVGKLVEDEAEIGAHQAWPSPVAPRACRAEARTEQAVIFRQSRLRVLVMAERSGDHAALGSGHSGDLGRSAVRRHSDQGARFRGGLGKYLAAKSTASAARNRSYRYPWCKGRSRRFQTRCSGHGRASIVSSAGSTTSALVSIAICFSRTLWANDFSVARSYPALPSRRPTMRSQPHSFPTIQS